MNPANATDSTALMLTPSKSSLASTMILRRIGAVRGSLRLQQNRTTSKISTLCQQLYTFLKMLSPPQPEKTMILPALHTKPTAITMDISYSLPPSNVSHTGSHPSPPVSNWTPPKDISKPYGRLISKRLPQNHL